MVELHISDIEKANRKLSSEHFVAAVKAVKEDGFVVLTDVVDLDHIEILHAKMIEDVQAVINRPDAPFNWNPGNVQQDPPPFAPYLFRDVLLNDLVIEITRAIVGDGVKNTLYSGNTAMPSEHRQPVHADCGHLWNNLKEGHPAHAIVVNVPLVDVSVSNGSTEIWPGTHLDVTVGTGGDIVIPEAALEAQRAKRPPFQPNIKRGSILIRDMRMWHAGMPNKTDQPRPMLAMIHHAGFVAVGEPMPFSKESEAFFSDTALHTHAQFVDGPINYLNAGAAYGYTPEEA